MAKLKPDPIGQDDLIDYLNNQSDFAFEIQVLKALFEAGFSCEHGGTYTDRASHFLRTITNAHMAKPFHPRTVRDTCARVMQSPLPPLPPGMR